MNLQIPEAMAHRVDAATGAASAGVVIQVSRAFGDPTSFVIWSVKPDGQIGSHTLDARHTDEARLTAHVRGFIENHQRAWARAAA